MSLETSNLDPNEAYIKALHEDIVHHTYSEDGDSWPPEVKQYVTLFHESTSLPSCIVQTNTGSFPDELVHSTDCEDHDDLCAKLVEVLPTILADCAALRRVVEYDDPRIHINPKESFLTIAARTPLCFSRDNISVQENVMVAMPRHSSGEVSPLFKHMRTRMRVPLLVSIEEWIGEIQSTGSDAVSGVEAPDAGHDGNPAKCTLPGTQSSHAEHSSGSKATGSHHTCESFETDSVYYSAASSGRSHEDVRPTRDTYPAVAAQTHSDADADPSSPDEDSDGGDSDSDDGSYDDWNDSSPGMFNGVRMPTMEEFLMGKFEKTPEEESDEDEDEDEEDQRNMSELDVHVLDYPPWCVLPTTCSLPVVCMAEEDMLPIVMSSVLRQRQAWHISEPVIGVAFSKYDTTVTICFGWVGLDLTLGNGLGRIHIGHIQECEDLNVAVPLWAVLVSRFFLSLDDHFGKLRDAARSSKAAVLEDIRAGRVGGWRLDTCLVDECEEDLIGLRERVEIWLDGLQHKDDGSQKSIVEGSKGQQDKDGVRGSSHNQPVEGSSGYAYSTLPIIRTPDDEKMTSSHESGGNEVFKLQKALSCSVFAARLQHESSADAEERMIKWLFDRRAVLESTLLSNEMRGKYEDVSHFFWPTEWKQFSDLPWVGTQYQPLAEELWRQLGDRRSQPQRQVAEDKNRVARGPADHALIVSAMTNNFTSVLQTCYHAQQKNRSPCQVTEAEWRHDHDRLFVDFFQKGLKTESDSSATSMLYATFERTLQMPCSSFIKQDPIARRRREVQALESEKPSIELIELWAGADHDEAMYSKEYEVAHHLNGIWMRWRKVLSNIEIYSRLGQAPKTGRCDTLGTLRIPVPFQEQFPSDCRLCHRAYKTQPPRPSTSGPSTSPAGSNAAGRQNDEGDGVAANKKRGGTKSTPTFLSTSSHTAESQKPKKAPPVIDLMGSSWCASRGPDTVIATVDELSSEFAEMGMDESSSEEDRHSPAYNTRSRKVKKGSQSAATPAPRTDIPQPPSTSADVEDEDMEEVLELPIVIVEYKTNGGKVDGRYIPPKGANQHRMYCAAATRFLEAIGIKEYPVFSIICEGPLAMLTVAWTDKQGVVHIGERHTVHFDISTPMGSWEYATVLCRLAHWQSRALLSKFKSAQDELVNLLRLSADERDDKLGWAMGHKIDKLERDGTVVREKKEKSKDAQSQAEQTSQ